VSYTTCIVYRHKYLSSYGSGRVGSLGHRVTCYRVRSGPRSVCLTRFQLCCVVINLRLFWENLSWQRYKQSPGQHSSDKHTILLTCMYLLSFLWFVIFVLSFVLYTWNDLSHRRPALMALTFPAAYHNRNVIFFS